MFNLGLYSIYPEAIEYATDIFNKICEDYKLGYLWNEFDVELRENGDCTEPTDSIIHALFIVLKDNLQDQGVNCDFYVNCDDSHFYINNEEVTL